MAIEPGSPQDLEQTSVRSGTSRSILGRVFFGMAVAVAVGLGSAWIVHSASVTKTYTFTAGTTISADEVNTNFDTLYTEINSKDTRISAVEANTQFCCRLSLSNTLAVPTAALAAQTQVYLHPYLGNKIALYDGTSSWTMRTLSSAISVAIPATTDTNFDVFVYNNGGTLTLETVDWAVSTAGASSRATALTTQDGILVKTGETNKRYVGTGRTTGVAGQTEVSLTKIFLWNYYNRVPLRVKNLETTNQWNYNNPNNAWRSANASNANRIEVVVGVQESMLQLQVFGFSSTAGAGTRLVGIGANDTTSLAADAVPGLATAAGFTQMVGTLYTSPFGYNYYQWIEQGDGGVSVTFSGDSRNGLVGFIDG